MYSDQGYSSVFVSWTKQVCLQTRHKSIKYCSRSTYTKIVTIPRRLAWPLRKVDTQIREAFHSWCEVNQSINCVYFQTKCEQRKQININQISLIIIMHWWSRYFNLSLKTILISCIIFHKDHNVTDWLAKRWKQKWNTYIRFPLTVMGHTWHHLE